MRRRLSSSDSLGSIAYVAATRPMRQNHQDCHAPWLTVETVKTAVTVAVAAPKRSMGRRPIALNAKRINAAASTVPTTPSSNQTSRGALCG